MARARTGVGIQSILYRTRLFLERRIFFEIIVIDITIDTRM